MGSLPPGEGSVLLCCGCRSSPHHPKALLEVTIRLARSWREGRSWKNKFAASGSNGVYPTSWIYTDIGIDR